MHARSSIARGRRWQAVYMLNGLRDQVLSLVCLRHGLPTHEGRGIDDLPDEVTERLAGTLVHTRVRRALPCLRWRYQGSARRGRTCRPRTLRAIGRRGQRACADKPRLSIRVSYRRLRPRRDAGAARTLATTAFHGEAASAPKPRSCRGRSPRQINCARTLLSLGEFGFDAVDLRHSIQQRPEQSDVGIRGPDCLGQDRPDLGLHRSTVGRRSAPQPVAYPVVQIANTDRCHCSPQTRSAARLHYGLCSALDAVTL